MSGRGVGMDVVKRSIQALGGRISIVSKPGKGSTFTLSLPLTLAVLDGMVVSVGGQTLVVPLTAIIETLQPKAERGHRASAATRRALQVRDSFLPLIDVGPRARLSARDGRAPPVASRSWSRPRTAAVRRSCVDAIQGQRQVVIKSLEANYRPVDGIAAATILGDGRVALILDVDAVVATATPEGNFFDSGLQAAE